MKVVDEGDELEVTFKVVGIGWWSEVSLIE